LLRCFKHQSLTCLSPEWTIAHHDKASYVVTAAEEDDDADGNGDD